MQNSNVILFLQELVKRIGTKSPMFFRVLSIISGAFILITGIPEALTVLQIHIPDLWNAEVTKAVAWASRGIFFITILTTQSKPVGIAADSGVVIKATDEMKLPFTAKIESEVAAKKNVDVVDVSTTSDVRK